MAHPVSLAVDATSAGRNRLTTLVRVILVLPHALLVGPLFWSSPFGGAGFLGAAAYVLAVVSWFTILITGEHIPGIRDFSCFYLRWRTRAVAYLALLTDEYPPFGDGPYPARLEIAPPAGVRDKASVAVRLILVLPHVVLLCLLMLAWFATTVMAWFAILLTGSYPASLLPFGIGVMRWMLRVEAYMLLLVDEYPPFSLD